MKLTSEAGIYSIVNLVNNKRYIGLTKNLKKRKWSHFIYLNLNKHHNPKLQNSYNKHGKENFSFEILEECSEESLLKREVFWIDFYDSIKNGYNCKPGGLVGGRVAKIFHWINIKTKEELTYSVPDLSKKLNKNDKGFYAVISNKAHSSLGWTLKSRIEGFKKRKEYIRKSGVFSIKNQITQEIKLNLTTKEAREFLGIGKSSIQNLRSGLSKRSGDWTLLDADPNLFRKKKKFTRKRSWKENRSRWKLSILDVKTKVAFHDKFIFELSELTGLSKKRLAELISGRKKILQNRFVLIKAFNVKTGQEILGNKEFA